MIETIENQKLNFSLTFLRMIFYLLIKFSISLPSNAFLSE
jgi:hypothetical protein